MDMTSTTSPTQSLLRFRSGRLADDDASRGLSKRQRRQLRRLSCLCDIFALVDAREHPALPAKRVA